MQTIPAQQQINKLIQDNQGNLSTYPFPPNIAAFLPKRLRQEILRWMLQNYVWPQIQGRQPYEQQWDKLLNMAQASWKLSNMKVGKTTREARALKESQAQGQTSPDDKADISDTVIFDAVDRLTNLNHYLSFKDGLPMQFQLPKDVYRPMENAAYSPSADLLKSANCLLRYCAKGTNFYRKHLVQCRHHYTYGVSYACADFRQRIEPVKRRDPQNPKQLIEQLELTELGVEFTGISIRKIWLNTKLTVDAMQYQPCPFWYEPTPRFAIVANPYEPDQNPFGYVNLDSLPQAQWLASATETAAWYQAMLETNNGQVALTTLTKPELEVELNWILFPMLPLQTVPVQSPEGQELLQSLQKDELDHFIQSGQQEIWDFDPEGKKHYQLKRFIMEAFGCSLVNGQVEITRLQENYYPKGLLPLFGSAHIPDMDSGQYPKSIGNILESHYVQLCMVFNQFLDNKDLLNDPPALIHTMSPAMNYDLNRKGNKIQVNGRNDVERLDFVDGTGTTPQVMSMVREQAATSSKAVDAIIGKAAGSRTTATEASNVFETAMSGVTTDINNFNNDIAAPYADRMWDFMAEFVDPDVLQAITGQFGFKIKPEHFLLHLEIFTASGSSYIDSIQRQNNFRYMLEAGRGDPNINSGYLWKCLLEEWKIEDADKIVNDNGALEQVMFANNQACQTYLGDLVMVDPDQDHQIAMKVKTSYLKDRDSVWNTSPEYAPRGQMLVQQIMMHQKFLQLQQMQQQAELEAGHQPGDTNGSGGNGLQPLQNEPMPSLVGQFASHTRP